jgi:hypothetical protein
METLMAGAATIEIFLASVGIATVLGRLALEGVCWLMQDAGIGPRKQAAPSRQSAFQVQTTPRPVAALGSLAMVRVQMGSHFQAGQARHLPLRAR